MSRPRLEVADIFRRYGEAFRRSCGLSLTDLQRRVMSDVELCRTAAFGGQIEQCDRCGHRIVVEARRTRATGHTASAC